MSDHDDVLAANERFYRALEAYDADAMARVWAHETWVACVHPGWEIVRGWEEVEASWAAIFASASRLRLSVEDVRIHLAGECAWVLCVERITTRIDASFFRSRAQATNLFVRRDGGWLLAHHHASPVPEPELSEETSTVQ